MRPLPPMKSIALAVALYCSTASAFAATSEADLARLLEQLKTRVDRLEQRNADLERELANSRAQKPSDQTPAAREIEQRVQALELNQTRVSEGLARDTISENEPDLTARLKAVEAQAQGMQSAARKIDGLDDVSTGLSLTTVAQKPFGTNSRNSQLNYRADAFVNLPLGNVGDIEQRVFAQLRLGQGAGLSDLPAYSNANSSAFQMQGGLRPDDSVALLAQAWYQASIALPLGGFKPRSKQTLELNFGKMDPFLFFDQNAVAGDETRQFLNSAFVHNPLLDAGGDIGTDANGFAPGMRVSYYDFSDKLETWRLSAGIFGVGEKGSNYQNSLSAPLLMLQAESEQRLFGGLLGNYRIYAWSNPQSTSFGNPEGGSERHSGWGISADQRIGDGLTLFARYGRQVQGNVRFDQALTLGTEVNGSYWKRGGDSLGLAAGLLKTSQEYRDSSAATTPASGAERVWELYYRFRINKQFELSPNIQYIGNPAGDGSAEAIKILGLRAQLTY